MVELLILKTGAFDHFGDNSRYFGTGQGAEPFQHQHFSQFPFLAVHQEVLEAQVVEGVLDFVVETLDIGF